MAVKERVWIQNACLLLVLVVGRRSGRVARSQDASAGATASGASRADLAGKETECNIFIDHAFTRVACLRPLLRFPVGHLASAASRSRGVRVWSVVRQELF